MTLKSRAALLSQANTTLPDNVTQEISPEDVRTIVKDIIDSMISKNGDTGILDVLRYNSNPTFSNEKDLITKKYVDDINAFKQGGNSFTADAVLGTNDAFDLLFRAGNVNRGGVTDTAEWMFGVTSPFSNTHKSNKSLGNTLGSYAERWTNSDDDVMVWIRNDGFLYANTIGNDDSNNLEITQGGGANKIQMINGAQMSLYANTFFQFFSAAGSVGIGGSTIGAEYIATTGGTSVINVNTKSLDEGWTIYMNGNQSTDGSIRIAYDSWTNTVQVQERIAGVWTERTTIG